MKISSSFQVYAIGAHWKYKYIYYVYLRNQRFWLFCYDLLSTATMYYLIYILFFLLHHHTPTYTQRHTHIHRYTHIYSSYTFISIFVVPMSTPTNKYLYSGVGNQESHSTGLIQLELLSPSLRICPIYWEKINDFYYIIIIARLISTENTQVRTKQGRTYF